MGTPLYVAMVMGIVVLAASVISVELGLSVAVIEIGGGIAAGNRCTCKHPPTTTLPRCPIPGRPP